MTTLKQKIKLIIYHRYRQFQSETDEQITDRISNKIKEWLQQKQKDYKVARYDKAIIDELLEELEK